MSLQWMVYTLGLLLTIAGMRIRAIDEGFNLLIQSNTAEINQHPVRFKGNSLPLWLKGVWIRNGPGQFEMGNRSLLHAFDGFGKLSSWQFNGSDVVLFSTKFLRSGFYQESVKSRDIAPFMLFDGTRPDFSRLEKIKAFIRGVDNTNVNVVPHQALNAKSAEFFALSDVPLTYSFNLHLQTTGKNLYGAPLIHRRGTYFAILSTSHPLSEHATRNYINTVTYMHIIPFEKHRVDLIRIDEIGTQQIIRSLYLDKLPYMHVFGLSKEYATIFLHPVHVNIKTLFETGRSMESLIWDKDQRLRIFVINIKSGHTFELETDPVFILHLANSYTVDNRTLIVDMVTYSDISVIQNMRLDILRDPSQRDKLTFPASLRRYEIDLIGKHVKVNEFREPSKQGMVNKLDFPVINEQRRYSKYCFVYGTVFKADSRHIGRMAIVKKDVCGGAGDLAWSKADHYPMEPWFAPRPNATAEDDGVVLSVILDGRRNISYVGVFCGKSLRMLSWGLLPTWLPLSFHGHFFESSSP